MAYDCAGKDEQYNETNLKDFGPKVSGFLVIILEILVRY